MQNRHIPGPLIGSLVALLLVGVPASAALRIGANAGETLTGTNGPDHITGRGGNDLLKGVAGNDVYYFGDDWGQDTIIERDEYKVDGVYVPGGTDTLSFRGLSPLRRAAVFLVPEWGMDYARVYDPSSTDTINLIDAEIENVVGSRSTNGGDVLVGGTAKNVLQPGGGSDDTIFDYAGWNDGPGGKPELPTSNDTYKGLTQNSGTIYIADFGGRDLLDLRPLASDEVYLDAVDGDSNGTLESLQIVTGQTSQVIVRGQFAPYQDYTSATGQRGQIETLLFADGTESGANMASASPARQRLSAKQQKLAKVAPQLLDAARKAAKDALKPGDLPQR